ncbi:Bulb-type lectin domain containing protein [Parasponia andersonii]|uniref:Bulb-type lectin domain containing protein n=1 Tax=Parasponia andersonii TaxID=3476 RepID=A0A2P5BM53_PARAD|nr:Bulb-type lectin domain containing protein [Parasponia andersonii]
MILIKGEQALEIDISNNFMGVFLKITFSNKIIFAVPLLTSILFRRESLALLDSLRASESVIDGSRGLVSPDGIFEMGFISPGNSNSRYLGVWYNTIVVPVQTVVWVARVCNPIPGHISYPALFTINDTTGNLVVLDQNDKSDGIKLGAIIRKLSVWKSRDNLCPGDLSYGLEPSHPEFIIRKGPNKYFRMGLGMGIV